MDYARGKGLLKVTGILLIIFGAITILLTLSTISLPNIITAVIGFLSGLLGIFAGIIGVRNSKILEKAQLCFSVGLLLLIYLAIRSIYTIITASITFGSSDIMEQALNDTLSSNAASVNMSTESFVALGTTMAIVIVVIGSLIQLIIPILYVVGASLNKKGFLQSQQQPHSNPYQEYHQ